MNAEAGHIMNNNRRDFLKTVGTVGATGIAAAVGVDTAEAQAPPASTAQPAAALEPVSHAYLLTT